MQSEIQDERARLKRRSEALVDVLEKSVERLVLFTRENPNEFGFFPIWLHDLGEVVESLRLLAAQDLALASLSGRLPKARKPRKKSRRKT